MLVSTMMGQHVNHVLIIVNLVNRIHSTHRLHHKTQVTANLDSTQLEEPNAVQLELSSSSHQLLLVSLALPQLVVQHVSGLTKTYVVLTTTSHSSIVLTSVVVMVLC
jgi:hypothetical protein